MLRKILIANRGEVAARIARSCRRVGATTVAVHTANEAEAVHVADADEVFALVGDDPVAPYLDATTLIEAAKQTGCDAIHPGYGLLARDPAFTRAVRDAGLVLVGPSAELLELCLDRVKLRAIAQEEEVRLLPASSVLTDLSTSALEDAVIPLGWPVVAKSARAGGSAFVADDADEIEEAVRHALAAVPSAGAYLESAVYRPRHVEVELVGSVQSDHAALGDREASVRHAGLRLIEESPAAALALLPNGDYLREAMIEASLRIAKRLGVEGVATARFVLDARSRFYFLGLDVGLSRGHLLHELCTGVDTVEVQLLAASGEPIPEAALTAVPTGNAICARIVWDGTGDGTVEDLRFPPMGVGRSRVEPAAGPRAPMVSGHDPTVALCAAYAPTRHQAMLALDRMLAEAYAKPLATNVTLMRRILAHEAFRASQYDCTTMDRMLKQQV